MEATGNKVDIHTSDSTENHSGTYSTAAIHAGQRRIFVGLGGWQDATHPSIDTASTPFLRALDWVTLHDAWPTAVGADGIRRYTIPSQPMYANPGEVALSAPAVVNDVVFVGHPQPHLSLTLARLMKRLRRVV